jgi:hypothetical protein
MMRIEIIPDHADQVFDEAGHVIDRRKLGIKLVSLNVRRIGASAIASLSVGTVLSCGRDGRGSDTLIANFYAPEGTHAWMAGTRGTIAFRLRTMPRLPQLCLRMFGRRSIATDAPCTVRICVNEIDVGSYALSGAAEDILIDIAPSDMQGRTVVITLEASHAEAVYDDQHEIVDPRLLGLGVAGIGVLERYRRPDDPDDAPSAADDTVAGAAAGNDEPDPHGADAPFEIVR